MRAEKVFKYQNAVCVCLCVARGESTVAKMYAQKKGIRIDLSERARVRERG